MKKLLSLLALALALLMLASCGDDSYGGGSGDYGSYGNSDVDSARAAVRTYLNCVSGEGDGEEFVKLLFNPVYRDYCLETGEYDSYDEMVADFQWYIDDIAEDYAINESEFGPLTNEFEFLETYEYTEEQITALAQHFADYEDGDYTSSDVQNAVTFLVKQTGGFGDDIITRELVITALKVKGEWSVTPLTPEAVETITWYDYRIDDLYHSMYY